MHRTYHFRAGLRGGGIYQVPQRCRIWQDGKAGDKLGRSVQNLESNGLSIGVDINAYGF